MAKGDKPLVPKAMQAIFEEIVNITDTFCEEFLDEEYADVCWRLAVDLCNKRPSPLLRGRPRTWAAGIVYTAGQINFLSDPDQEPSMTGATLAKMIGVSLSSMSAKKRIIQNALKLTPFDPDYMVTSLLMENPAIWMIEVDGFVIDTRTAPREIQEEAYAQGLIPFVPANLEGPVLGPDPDDEPNIIKFPRAQSRRPKDSGNGDGKAHHHDDEPGLFQDLDE